MIKRLFPSLHLFFLLSLCNVIIFTLFRAIFYLWFSTADESISSDLVYHAFYIGLKFDIQLATLINLPIILLAWIPFLKVKLHSFSRPLWMIYLFAINSLILSIYFIDMGHYDYLHKRIDITIIRFIEDIAISTEMVLESYPVFSINVALIILISFVMWLFFRFFNVVAKQPRVINSKKFNMAQSISAFIIIFIAVFGHISTYSLRWSDAYFSPHPFISALASNPITYFYNTLKNNKSSFDLEKSLAAYPLMADYLQLPVDSSNPEKINFIRHEKSFSPFNFSPVNNDKPNIVMVFLESFAYFKTGISGNPLKPTPYFDSIAKKGILFDHFYTPHGGTARSVFTAITGIPDIELVKTSSRNPLIVSQNTIINSFTDYKKLYFIGGSVSWGNIRGLLGNNISDINFYEEFDYKSTRVDVWGIQDLDLFAETNLVLKQLHKQRKDSKQPFFAIIQTSGNHRPYTIPDDNHGFKLVDKTLAEVQPYGFRSVADYNSFRYLDFSLGYYIKLIENEDYAKNTIFVFFGDHGNERQAKHLPPSVEQLGLTEFHVPFLIYAPGSKTQGQVIHTIASEVDVLATIASSAGINYTNTTFGRDLFNTAFDKQRYAFTFFRSQPPDLGLISDKFYFKMKSGGENLFLFDLNSKQPTKNVITQYPDYTQKMKQLAQAYYESIRYVRHNNKSSVKVKDAP